MAVSPVCNSDASGCRGGDSGGGKGGCSGTKIRVGGLPEIARINCRRFRDSGNASLVKRVMQYNPASPAPALGRHFMRASSDVRLVLHPGRKGPFGGSRMKSFLSMAALCCAAALVGCNNNKT